jgi:nucleoside-diphosphate-sugar epimerase
MSRQWNVMVTGGAGYVGAVLVPKLLAAGHQVTVLDLAVQRSLVGTDAVIHLACISNDPSFELDPGLGKAINFDAFRPLVRMAKRVGVRRFIYASSSSVYGIKEGVEVTEDLPLEPLTDYSKFKAMCESVLAEEREPGFVTMVIRPATVCGYSPRQRLDVIVNILTNFAVNKGFIKVFGGRQLRPNIHIEDMVAVYLMALQLPDDAIDGKIYNAADENYSVDELAEIVRGVVGPEVQMVVEPTNDPRSYHVSGKKMERELGFRCRKTIRVAVEDMTAAFRAGKLPNSFDDPRYFNIRMMQQVGLR